MKKIIVYLPDGFADWEGAFLLPELMQTKTPFMTVSEDGQPITSIGGLKVTPDGALTDLSIDQIGGLVMIGSDTWWKLDQNLKVLALAKELSQREVLVAGICAASSAMGRAGLLNSHKHTSNDISSLKRWGEAYLGEHNYQNKLATTDGHLITASGNAPIEFTFEIIRFLKMLNEENSQHWFGMYKSGKQPPDSFWQSY